MRPTPDLERAIELDVGLVVAVQDDAGRVDTGEQRRVQLAAGRDVHEQSLLRDDLQDRRGLPCLRGVDDVVGPERGRVGPAAGAQLVTVDDVQRCAVLLRQRVDRDTTDGEHTAFVARHTGRPRGTERGTERHGAHIRSGAPTRSTPSAFASTCFAALISQ